MDIKAGNLFRFFALYRQERVDDALKVCAHCGTPLDHVALDGLCPRCVALDMFTPTPDSGPLLAREAERPRFLGKYEILDEIARGGMGVVYRARHSELNRIVAIKTIVTGVLAGDEAIRRFQGEAIAAASLSHPNIVTIHEVGQWQGQHYFAMEYVAGPNLSTIVRDGPLPAKSAARYVHAVAEGVQHAHSHGVLHRDLKPSNVLLDEQDRPRITDFGLSKRLDAQDMTLSGQVLGTPAYTAPEQAGRKSGTIGPRTDVYGLGAILYQLITGRAPFTGESATEILAQVIQVEPIAPRLLHPALPRDLETICLKCLEKDSSRRYGSAEELAKDLGRFIDDRPIQARPITPAERGWRWCKRKPGLALSLSVIAFLLVGITALSNRAKRRMEGLRLEGLANLYASDMRLAQQAISESKFGAAAALLERHRPQPGDPDLRGFEWHHFREICQSEETAALEPHSNQVQRVAFSADGQLFATASTELQVWEVATRRRVLQRPVGFFVWALAFAPDSRHILIGDNQNNVAQYDVRERGNAPDILSNLSSLPLAFAWPDSGTHILTHDQLLSWNGTSQTAQLTVQFKSGFARASVAGNFAAMLAGPSRVTIWQLKPPVLRREFSLSGLSRAIALSSDGNRLAVGDFSGALRTWEITAEGKSNVFTAHRGLIECVAFSPDGERVASAGADQIIRVHEPFTGKLLLSRHGHLATVMALAFSPNGQWIASGDKLGQVKLWNLQLSARPPAQGEVALGTLSQDGSYVAVRNEAKMFDLRPVAALERAGPVISLKSAAWPSPCANGILEIDAEGNLCSYDTNNVRKEHGTGQYRFAIGTVSPNGRFAALGLKNGDGPFVWDLSESRLVFSVTNEKRWLSPAFSRDSRRFAYGLPSGHVHIWELPSGKEVSFFQAHKNNYAYSCDLSSDGSHLATAGFDGAVRLWEVDGAKLIGEYRSTADAYWTVALAPDGRRIAAGTSESSIVLWDVMSGHEVATFQFGPPMAPVEGLLRFAADSSALSYANGLVRSWRAPQNSL